MPSGSTLDPHLDHQILGVARARRDVPAARDLLADHIDLARRQLAAERRLRLRGGRTARRRRHSAAARPASGAASGAARFFSSASNWPGRTSGVGSRGGPRRPLRRCGRWARAPRPFRPALAVAGGRVLAAGTGGGGGSGAGFCSGGGGAGGCGGGRQPRAAAPAGRGRQRFGLRRRWSRHRDHGLGLAARAVGVGVRRSGSGAIVTSSTAIGISCGRGG